MVHTDSVRGIVAAEKNLFRNVYLWMTAGLAITGVVAYGIAGSQLAYDIALNPFFMFAAILVELGIVWTISARIMRMSPAAATIAFAVYAAVNGLTLSIIFFTYEIGAIGRVFFITAGTFAAVSVFATMTRKNLAGFGHVAFMGVIGIIIASVVNMFLRSEALDYIISYIGVAVFTVLTAVDTQAIKRMSAERSDISDDDYVRLSILGALKLYLDFVNMFLFLLRIFGRRS